MTDEEPWWWPLRKALVKKAADFIANIEFTPPPGKDPLVVEAEYEDLPAKPSRKRRKALPAHPVPAKNEDPPNREDST